MAGPLPKDWREWTSRMDCAADQILTELVPPDTHQEGGNYYDKANGLRLNVSSYNADYQQMDLTKPPVVTRPAPPLTEDQLTKFALDPRLRI